MNELIKIKRQTIGENEINAVDARELHAYLESGQKFANWIQNRVDKYNFTESVDFVRINNFITSPPSIEYALSLDMAKELSMVERNEKGKQARQYFIECEKRALQQPYLPEDYPTALRMLANEVEQKQLAISQRDEAIRTKAHISDKKTATAMATASAAVRKAGKLADEIGRGTNWKSAKAIPWVKEFFLPSRGMWSSLGKKLTAISDELDVKVEKIESEQYGLVNAYHVAVIEKLRNRLEADVNMLGKYRHCEN